MGMFLLGWLGGYATWRALTPTCRRPGKLYGVTPPRGRR